MRKKKIKESCGNIYFLFNDAEGGFTLDEFGDDLTGGNELYESKNIESERITGIYHNARNVFFSLGYALGQMVDVTDEIIRPDVELIKKAIREKHLLPYLPRERAA